MSNDRFPAHLISIEFADSPTPVDTVRTLFREYADAIGTDLEYQGFSAELATLPGAYAAPDGALLLVSVEGEPAGCVAFKRLDEHGAELKRLFVRPAYRALGLGRWLVGNVIDLACVAKYRTLRLDTLAHMTGAQNLYRRIGFREIAPYGDGHMPGTRFFELKLYRMSVPVFRLSSEWLERYRALRFDPEAERHMSVIPYETLIWTDEHPGGEGDVPELDETSHATIFRLITTRSTFWSSGDVPLICRQFWEDAKATLPDWPGFRRLSVSKDEMAMMKQWSNDLDRAERACERLERLQKRASRKAARQ
ncbi:MAG TPA: GNAT family N-acetyltransferase [Candidatus Eisenbacteria bacterium]